MDGEEEFEDVEKRLQLENAVIESVEYAKSITPRGSRRRSYDAEDNSGGEDRLRPASPRSGKHADRHSSRKMSKEFHYNVGGGGDLPVARSNAGAVTGSTEQMSDTMQQIESLNRQLAELMRTGEREPPPPPPPPPCPCPHPVLCFVTSRFPLRHVRPFPSGPPPAPSVPRNSRIEEMQIESSSSRARRRRPRTLVARRPVRLRSRARSTPLVASPLLGLGVRVGGWFLTRTPGRRPSGLKRRRRCTGALRRATRAPSRLPSVGAAGGWWAALHHGGQSRRRRRRHRLRAAAAALRRFGGLAPSLWPALITPHPVGA